VIAGRAGLAILLAVAAISACAGPFPRSGPPAANPVVQENARSDRATDWYRPPSPTGIAAYPITTSVPAGGSLQIAVSTTSQSYTIDVFRMGWYAGAEARHMRTVTGLRGENHGQWRPNTFGVQDCPTCTYDRDTGLLQLDWPVSYTLALPASWISGDYVVRLTTNDGRTAYVPFVVRDRRPSTVLAVFPVNTYQAYNEWGGKSLYSSNSFGPPTLGVGSNAPAALQVTFERPYADDQASAKADYRTVSFLERQGYDVTYATSADLDRDRTLLAGHRVVIMVGHDEYWSRGMRDAVESGRDRGLGVLFLSGNSMYWQVRYGADAQGRDHEVLICYRTASIDPDRRTNPALVTVRWVEPPVSDSPDSVIGGLYTGRVLARPTTWVVAATAPAWLLLGTGLQAGSSIAGLVGIECDGVVTAQNHPFGWEASHPPADMVIVSASPVVTASGSAMVSNTIYYRTARGGQVFSVGTWSWQEFLSGPGRSQAVVRMTDNVLRRFGA
jgi:hypothetical protein